jgi:DNA-directed RNA polymerase subunit RPC12/RpoP
MTEPKPKKRQRRPTKCPKCGSRVLPIVYGMPSVETRKEIAEGKIALGGCIVAESAPTWRCDECGREGGQLKVSDYT